MIRGEYDVTTVHPLSLVVLVVLAAFLLMLPRRFASLPLLIVACVVPFANRVAVVGVDFNFIRILVLVGVVRILARGEARSFRWTPLDVAFLAWAVSTALIPIIRAASMSMLVYRLGVAFDALGIYFVSRFLIRDWRDVAHLAKGALLVCIPTACLFLVESQTGKNAFYLFGGVPLNTLVREGQVRAQGPFVHSIQAGSFWVGLAPLIAARWFHPHGSRVLVVAALVGVVTIVIACSSSTPLVALLGTIVGACFYPIRFQLRWVRWSGVVALLSLQLVMNNPVWSLIGRVGVVSGSTGWHRYMLIDRFLRNFDEWWLIGTSTTAHWGHGLTDLTNEYVAQGVRAGLLSLAALVFILIFAYRQVGIMLRRVRGHPPLSAYAWCLGLCVFANMAIMFSVSYWAQIIVPWYMVLASIGSLTVTTQRMKTAAPARPRPRSAPLRGAGPGTAAPGPASALLRSKPQGR